MDSKKVVILGSTGSVGTQCLDVIRDTQCAEVFGLSGNENDSVLLEQILEFKPKYAYLKNEKKAKQLKNRLANFHSGIGTEILTGTDEPVGSGDYDILLNSIVGSAGLIPTIKAIKNGKDIALANKETLVAAGEIIMPLAREHNVKIFPVDSEHSAIFQCLQGNRGNDIEKIILTASGGSFREKGTEELAGVAVKDALRHPNWSMGRKITIDSATLMNKGLEVIEACWLFDVGASKIQCLVHPQSIIHSMVEFVDGSVIAQLGLPDMKAPIQYALTYPNRIKNSFKKINFYEISGLTFETPRFEDFPCLNLAYDAIRLGGLFPCVLNGANEAAVSFFLDEKINFLDISRVIEKTLDAYNSISGHGIFSVEDVLEADKWAKRYVGKLI